MSFRKLFRVLVWYYYDSDSDGSRDVTLKRLKTPEINSLESITELFNRLQNRALAGRYDNPIPTQFLAPIDCSTIPALCDKLL
jgi:hypothetical protein